MKLPRCRVGFVASLFLSALLASSGAVHGQAAPTSQPLIDPDAPNLIHGRHLSPRNPAHPRAVDAKRFVTSRAGALQLPLPEEKDAFTFVVFGDRTGGPASGVNVLADAVRDTNLLEPDMVLTVGDLVQGYNEAPEYVGQVKEYKSIMSRLICPWFPVAGNHDVYWRDKDRSGDVKPEGENEKEFETHFGPLWYAFSHKNSWFIALYSDEGNPETGEKNFSKPEANVMSEAQFGWLKETLAKAKNADHVFLFLHHPRWLGSFDHGGYGDSWARVHKALVEAGNVTAVFAGHIHYMRSDPKDGIEYLALATVGGGQDGTVPDAGFLHQYHVVTVRKNQVAMAAFPVGQAMDVREISGAVSGEVRKLAATPVTFDAPMGLKEDGSAFGLLKVKVSNPTSRPVEFTLSPESRDSRWLMSPDHQHKVVEAGATLEVPFRVRRVGSPLDETFRMPEVVVDADYLMPSKRYAIPTRRVVVPMDVSGVPTTTNQAMRLTEEGTGVAIPNAYLGKVTKAFTLEARINADGFDERTGLISKMQSSGYGIFVSNGRPSTSVSLGGSYLTISAPRDFKLKTGQWYDIASVFDGRELRLYVDGKLLAKGERENSGIQDNKLPLVIGADVGGSGESMDTFRGQLDGVRLSSVARYKGESYTPPTRPTADKDTVLLLNMDHPLGKWLYDESGSGRFFEVPASGKLLPVK